MARLQCDRQRPGPSSGCLIGAAKNSVRDSNVVGGPDLTDGIPTRSRDVNNAGIVVQRHLCVPPIDGNVGKHIVWVATLCNNGAVDHRSWRSEPQGIIEPSVHPRPACGTAAHASAQRAIRRCVLPCPL